MYNNGDDDDDGNDFMMMLIKMRLFTWVCYDGDEDDDHQYDEYVYWDGYDDHRYDLYLCWVCVWQQIMATVVQRPEIYYDEILLHVKAVMMTWE